MGKSRGLEPAPTGKLHAGRCHLGQGLALRAPHLRWCTRGSSTTRQKLQALNIGVPKTFQQFLSDLALAKKAGQVPLILGDAQGFPLLHDFQLFVDSFGGASAWKNFVYGVGHPKGKFASPAVLQGAAVVVKLGADGLVNSDHAGTQLLDMVSRFTKGDGVFMITGTWFVSTVQTAMKSNVGFAVMPSATGQPPATNGDGTPWGSRRRASTLTRPLSS